MCATVTIEKDKLDMLVRETKSRSKASAVKIVIDEHLKKKRSKR